ncbi:glycoside hydrolase domain-containing protein [Arthrobacter sp. 1P04PC]|uniref:glycoside hydrolase domain-containing protein n=1 Tax=unclassified Arthrobacter TaxID=235627 RepID=UPI0039A2D771
MDQWVQNSQKWLNFTYGNVAGYTPVAETGVTGWLTMYAMTRALQHELGITALSDGFGEQTLGKLEALGTIDRNFTGNSNIVRILQCGLWCKGYSGGAIDGKFSDLMDGGIASMRQDMGLTPQGGVTAKIFKSLLTMDAYVTLPGGSNAVRQVQQWLNLQYSARKYFYFVPADGYFSRDVQIALVTAIQFELGLSDDSATGSFGPTTQSMLKSKPALTVGAVSTFVRLFQAAMIFNNQVTSFTGTFDATTSASVRSFQNFSVLPVTGSGDWPTWASLLVSTGDPERKTGACDCVTGLSPAHVSALKAAGYKTVGRYLKGQNKRLMVGEVENIHAGGMTFFPIFQDFADGPEYFSEADGYAAGVLAAQRAWEARLKRDTVIYFAVDYDATIDTIQTRIIPHFQGIKRGLASMGMYRAGVYGTRNVCSQVSAANLATFSFVGGMSTGYSGNLGYALPTNWAFDQIKEFWFTTPQVQFGLDNDVSSGRDNGISALQVETVANSNAAFFSYIDQLNVLADGMDASTRDRNRMVLRFLMKPDYVGLNWDVLTGAAPVLYGLFESQALAIVPRQAYFDAVTGLGIGVSHMAASASAYMNSSATTPSGKAELADLGGWAGDLLSSIGNYMVEGGGYADLYQWGTEMFGERGHRNWNFAYDDLVADADAFLVNREMTRNPNLRIADLCRTLLGNTSTSTRISRFVTERFGSPSGVTTGVTSIFTSNDPAFTIPADALAGQLQMKRSDVSPEMADQAGRAFRDVLLRLHV